MGILPESLARQQDMCVNFKGFVGDWKNNTGEDRGYLINTAKGLLARYSLYGQRRVYRIVASRGREILGTMLVEITEPSLAYLVLRVNNNQRYALKDRETICASLDDYLTVEAIKSNIGKESEIGIRANGDLLIPGEAERIGDITGTSSSILRIDITRQQLPLGAIYIEIV